MKVIIIDDEEKAITTLKAMLKEFFKGIDIAGTASNGTEGLELLSKVKVDVVFLDINMPGMDGLEMLQQLEERNFRVVITSAYERYALKAIKNKVYDYLLKPINIDELEKLIHLIESELKEKSTRLIKLSDKKGTVHIKPDDIYYVRADGRYSEVNCTNKQKYYISKNIGEFEEELKDLFFFRVHKSYVINCKYVNHVSKEEGSIVKLENGTVIELSRRKRTEFLAFLKAQ